MIKPNVLGALKEIVKHFDNNPATHRFTHSDLKYAIAAGRKVIEQTEAPAACKDCIHWDKFAQPFNDDLYGVCVLINEAYVFEERSVIAYVSDCGEGSSHRFHTRMDFSCMVGVEKEDKNG